MTSTRYGVCFFQTGPRLVPERCEVGAEADMIAVLEGDVTVHQDLTTRAIEQLQERVRLTEFRIAHFERDNRYAFWLARARGLLTIRERRTARVERMSENAKRAHADDEGGTQGKSPDK